MKYFRKNEGITLIALVITIIIMLILATVSIRIAVNGGLFKYAGKATHSYQIASEREYLEQNVLSVRLDKYLENVSTEKLGKSLGDNFWCVLFPPLCLLDNEVQDTSEVEYQLYVKKLLDKF